MTEIIILLLLYGGGILVAFVVMAIASPNKRTKTTRYILLILAFLSLLTQGGCWLIAAGIGRATGGSGSSQAGSILLIAIIIYCIWSYLIISTTGRSDRPK
jgi:hypothetical protein